MGAGTKRNGGARPGAGRPVGVKSRINKELIERAQAGGIMPIDVFLNDMRFYYNLGEQKMQLAKDTPPGKLQAKHFRAASELKTVARDCARDAAPYVHSKLASIQNNVNLTNVEAELSELE